MDLSAEGESTNYAKEGSAAIAYRTPVRSGSPRAARGVPTEESRRDSTTARQGTANPNDGSATTTSEASATDGLRDVSTAYTKKVRRRIRFWWWRPCPRDRRSKSWGKLL